MNLTHSCTLELPSWLGPLLGRDQRVFGGETAAMQFAVELARANIEHGTGGPFAAVVLDPIDGRVISVGVNAVTGNGLSVAHAEMVALSLAQKRLGDWNLARGHALTLLTTCEPCAMCYGALPWSGIRRLVCGARKNDAEHAGFDEGDKPDDWVTSLERRGIEVRLDLLRSLACELFSQYRAAGGEIYNASMGTDHE